jgi:hypothetical protein
MPENQDLLTETGADTSSEQDASQDQSATNPDLIPKAEVDNLLKALKAERESRKTYEKELREKTTQLEKFAQINPEEYRRLQEEAAIAERERIAAEERTSLLEEKYGSQAAEANKRAEQYQVELKEFRKRYALEKVFFSAGGRTDADGGVSFFDLLADRLGNHFRLESNGAITVIDANGDPVLAADTGKRILPEEYLSTFKEHPIYGTFFKNARGSGAGIGFGGTDVRGLTAEDITALSTEEMFERAFG